jgi:hypothetical protein
MMKLVEILKVMGLACLFCAMACVGAKPMESMDDTQLIEQLTSKDYRVSTKAAATILGKGEQMVEPLLRMKGRKQPYTGALGNPRGSTTTVMPLPGFSLTPEQQEKVVTVEAAALYLISAIYEGRLDFASSALLADLDLPPERRKAANKEEYLERGFASARAWSDSRKKDGLQALRDRGEDPLKRARLSFW